MDTSGMTSAEYLDYILEEIEKAEIENRTGVFKVNEKLKDEVAEYVKNYLEKRSYKVFFRKCKSCLHTWDILIYL